MTTETSGGPALIQQRRIVTPLPGPRSQELLARKAAAVAQGVGHTAPIAAVAAGGGVIVDADGNSLIDLGAGIAVTNVGNAHPAVVKAIQVQAAQFTHTCFMVSPYEGYVAVAERLNAITPGNYTKKSALFNSGAEAVENAVKIARKYTGRQAVVSFDHGYHGRTNLTMALTAKVQPYKAGFGPFAPEVYRVAASYPYRDGLSGAQAARRTIMAIEKQVGAAYTAAIIIEPIQGEGGFIVPAEGFLPALAAWARENGIVIIADEIQTGFARTGTMFASEQFGFEPDLITTAKGIAGGMPLAAVTGKAEMMDASHVGGLGGTYGGNPIACAAALATMDVYESEDLAARALRIGAAARARLEQWQSRDPRVGEVRGLGAMIAVELVDPATKEPDAALASSIAKAAIAQGVVVLTCGTYGNVLRLLPPLTIGLDLLAEGLDVLEEVSR